MVRNIILTLNQVPYTQRGSEHGAEENISIRVIGSNIMMEKTA
jgi:hypothetical protein